MMPVSERMRQRSFEAPYDRQSYDKLTIDLVNLGNLVVSRNVYQPGWRWSESVGPSVPTQGCQIRHLFYCVSGRMHVVMNEGGELELGPGEVGLVPAGHHASVVGDEPVTLIDFGGNKAPYVKRRS